jgi:hypothetical protein
VAGEEAYQRGDHVAIFLEEFERKVFADGLMRSNICRCAGSQLRADLSLPVDVGLESIGINFLDLLGCEGSVLICRKIHSELGALDSRSPL